MEDKRIIKTKKYLKDTLIELLDEMPFEKITVTMLCQKADISRITFYSHYDDKYDLVEDIFQDMIAAGTGYYDELENRFNKDNDIALGFSHVMDSILKLYYNKYYFFRHVTPERNPYLASSYYNHVFSTVEKHTNKENSRHPLKYSNRQITGFLCYGLLGFINESHNENDDFHKNERDAHQLLSDILNNGILF